MQYLPMVCLCLIANLASAQHLTLRSSQDKSTKTIKIGQRVKLVTPDTSLANLQLPVFQFTSGRLVRVSTDSIYLNASHIEKKAKGKLAKYESDFKFKKSGQMPVAFAKRDIHGVQKLSKTRKTLGVIAIVGTCVGVSTLFSSALVADKSGGARLWKVGAISLGAGVVLGGLSNTRPTPINHTDCWSPWVVE